MDSFDTVVAQALALLRSFAAEQLAPAVALERFAPFRLEHAALAPELVWQRDSLDARAAFDVLLTAADGTVSVSFAPRDELPWAVRGMQHASESWIARVNGRPVRVQELVSMLDAVWAHLDIGKKIVDAVLVEEECERARIEPTAAGVAQALAAFRQSRGLQSADALARWMGERGMTPAELERLIRGQAQRAALEASLGAPFDEWLAERRRSARVEWFWGKADPIT